MAGSEALLKLGLEKGSPALCLRDAQVGTCLFLTSDSRREGGREGRKERGGGREMETEFELDLV